MLPYALFDAQAAAYGFGGPDGSPTDAAAAAARHLADATAMQQRRTDGAMYVSRTEYTYVGREEHTAQLAAQLVLTLTLTASVDAADAVAPADVDPGTDDQLRTPPAPSDESRLMQTGRSGSAG